MEQSRDRDARRDVGQPARVARSIAEQDGRSTASPRDDGAGAKPPEAPVAADHRTRSRRAVQRALSSRSTLRQAILLHEILGPPKALQPPAGKSSHEPDGRLLD